jgi:hypothetical protein
MDKGFKAVIRRMQAHQMLPGGVPLAPQPAPQPPSAITDTLFSNFSPPVPLTGPQAPAAMSRPPPLQPAHRKKPVRSQATPIPPPIPTATPQVTAPSPPSRTPKSPKVKPKPPTRRKGSKRPKGVETPTAAHSVAPTSTTSKLADAKGGGKTRMRVRDADTDAPTPGVSSAPWPKRVKTQIRRTTK